MIVFNLMRRKITMSGGYFGLFTKKIVWGHTIVMGGNI